MTRYLLDTYAWIEYFEGSEKGEKVDKLISAPENEIFSNPVILAEVVSKAKRSGNDSEVALAAVRQLSKMIDIDLDTGRLAGELHYRYKKEHTDFGMIDALVLATSINIKAKIVTGDPHFKAMKDVVML